MSEAGGKAEVPDPGYWVEGEAPAPGGKGERSLRRSLSLLDVVALGINGIIGQGIFLSPGKAADKVGPAVLIAILCAGVLSFLIALCFAEVGSRFKSTGGAYLYARAAFGEFVGFEVGWMTCCVAVISWAALATGFTLVLGHFVPIVKEDVLLQRLVAVGLMGALAAVNVFGAKMGARVSTFFSVAKLIPLVLFIAVGLFFLEADNFTPFAPKGYGNMAETIVVVLYAFVGFETLVVPAGEMQNPQRAVPLATFVVMSLVCVVYLLVYLVLIGTFSALPGHDNPVAAASTGFLGAAGGTVVAVGICLSVFGTNAGAALVSPRRFFALAERGDLPPVFARTHVRSGAPVPAILITFGLAALLAATGKFRELLILAVMARFLQYIPTCLATIVLRAQDRELKGEPTGFRLPLGPLVPVLAAALSITLLVVAGAQDPWRLVWGGAALGLGVPLYFVSRAAGWTGTTTEDAHLSDLAEIEN